MSSLSDSAEFQDVKRKAEQAAIDAARAHKRIDGVTNDIGDIKGSVGRVEGALTGMRDDIHSIKEHFVGSVANTNSAATGQLFRTFRLLMVLLVGASVLMGLAWFGFNHLRVVDGDRAIEAGKSEVAR